MSRVGKKPIPIPSGVTVMINDRLVSVKGKDVELSERLPNGIRVESDANEIRVIAENEQRSDIRANWGLARALIANMVTGVTQGFEKKLEINGVGYNAKLAGKNLELKVGFSHLVRVEAPEGVTFSVDGNVITVRGASRQAVGQIAAEIRKVKKPEPYKGKGIKYQDEIIRRKAGKVVKASGE